MLKNILRPKYYLQLLLIMIAVFVFANSWNFFIERHNTPPEYSTFNRDQIVQHDPDPKEVLRIWMVYVEQGDGLIIQLPQKYNYTQQYGNEMIQERIDILVDGGSVPLSESNRFGDFYNLLYSTDQKTVEFTVITHHDEDHIYALVNMLEAQPSIFQTVYHNGLASYQKGKRNFPVTGRPTSPAIYSYKNGQISKGMAYLYPADHTHKKKIDRAYLIDNIDQLRAAKNNNQLQGRYHQLAERLIESANINFAFRFNRAYQGSRFIQNDLVEYSVDTTELKIKCLWPKEYLTPFGGSTMNPSWGETINGNSVTFQLTYGDFEMLFTGDHNELSEDSLLAFYDNQDQSILNCDVLKVPHHGSSHNIKKFFDVVNPVISIVSMGDKGFKSKEMNSRNWQHPSDDVIRWLGGSHRVYKTYVHEKYYKWKNITTENLRKALIEKRHILIETDGEWFRVVEIPLDYTNPNNPPSVADVSRGNGTRWISAK